jgi:hypothetical protein
MNLSGNPFANDIKAMRNVLGASKEPYGRARTSITSQTNALLLLM